MTYLLLSLILFVQVTHIGYTKFYKDRLERRMKKLARRVTIVDNTLDAETWEHFQDLAEIHRQLVDISDKIIPTGKTIH